MLRLSKADLDRWTFRPRGETITEEPRRPASAPISPLSPGEIARRRRWCRARVRSWAGSASGLRRLSSGSWERLVRRLAGGGVAWALPSGAAPPRSRIEPLKKDKKGRRSRPPFPVRPHCVHRPLLRTPSDGVVGGAATVEWRAMVDSHLKRNPTSPHPTTKQPPQQKQEPKEEKKDQKSNEKERRRKEGEGK